MTPIQTRVLFVVSVLGVLTGAALACYRYFGESSVTALFAGYSYTHVIGYLWEK